MNIKKIKIVLICAILAICLCLLTGCKDKTNEDEWLKNMERVSYIKLRGYNEKMLDNSKFAGNYNIPHIIRQIKVYLKNGTGIDKY